MRDGEYEVHIVFTAATRISKMLFCEKPLCGAFSIVVAVFRAFMNFTDRIDAPHAQRGDEPNRNER